MSGTILLLPPCALTEWAATPLALHLLSAYSHSMSSSLIKFLSSNLRSPSRLFPLHFYEQYFMCNFFTFFMDAYNPLFNYHSKVR